MNINEAKTQIKNALTAYFSKDEYGSYLIPIEKQRPVFLIGAPGIGKTAIMEQIARELSVPLVSYSMTHHTRQSALGLPFISHKVYDGQEYDVSEYTMSEIIASVYDMMEKTGKKEGILFLDEINCVSETLSPIMLQFLQYKVFGRHHVPEGWIVVTAGNPPEYNNSVHEFDIVTWDRLKRIDVEPEFKCWKEYALNAGVHPSVLSYLELKPDHFYRVESTVDGKSFVTARGWEDLSKMIHLYEKNNIPVDENLTGQYLQNKKISESFATYYDLFKKYRSDYQISSILNGTPAPEIKERAKNAKFDERITLLGLLSDGVIDVLSKTVCTEEFLAYYMRILRTVRNETQRPDFDAKQCFENLSEWERKGMELSKKAGTLSDIERQNRLQTIHALKELEKQTADCKTGADVFKIVKETFDKAVANHKKEGKQSKEKLENAFKFLEEVYGDGQEMVIFVTELTSTHSTARFISLFGSDAYFRHNKELLFYERQKEIVQEIDLLDLGD